MFTDPRDWAVTTVRPTIWDYRHHTNLVRIASSLRADMILGKDRWTTNVGSPRFGSILVCASNPSDGMSKFKITVARIEVDARGKQDAQVRITFRIDRAPISFQVPIFLSIRDFDDTEMVQAARSALYRTLVELAAQSQKWKLTSEDLRQLSSISLRPKT